jgi:hypothetical protein
VIAPELTQRYIGLGPAARWRILREVGVLNPDDPAPKSWTEEQELLRDAEELGRADLLNLKVAEAHGESTVTS